MKITRKNYESYFIDLIDGNLTTEQVDIVLDFLRENPDLAEELSDLEAIQLEPEHQTQFNYSKLLKTDFDQPDIFEETAVRSIENELSEDEKNDFENYLASHPKAVKEYQLFQATIAKPDNHIVYENKASLKKSRTIPLYWISAAAVVVLTVMFWFNKPTNNPIPNTKQQIIALNEKPEATINLEAFKKAPIKINTTYLTNIEPHKSSNNTENNRANATDEIVPAMPMTAMQTKLAVNTEQEMILSLPQSPAKNLNEYTQPYPTVKELLAQQIEKVNTQKEVGKFTQFALDQLKNATNEKLDYTTAQGKVQKIEFSSRLIGFSIPLNNK